MTAFIIRRLLHGLVVLILVTILIFFAMRLLPGDPLLIYLAQRSQALQDLPPEVIEQLRHEYGLDKPLPVQYINWLSGIFRGDLGDSYFYRQSVGNLLRERFPITVYLGILALIISIIVGISAGMLAAIRRGKWLDNVVTPLTYLGVTIPIFWLGILMIYIFGLKLQILPIAGFTSPFVDFSLSTRQLIMPVICESIFGIASNARQMRSSMLEVIRQDYIRTAWSKGLGERVVIFKHAIKNSLIPVITLIGMGVSFIFGGSVLVETVFAIPGVGRLFVSGIFNHDYLVVQGITMVMAVVVLLVNLIVDISYGWLDPRIRYG
ncbi:MAG: peptide ABC transporter [Chloroflexi bacterium RBG_16_56_11]|nr:MAG: peptide ABC transporter [Chloroflexi bacterium RBG_16_56_11]